MSTQAEAADQVVKIMLDGGEHVLRIAGVGAKNLAVLLYAALKNQKRTKGKTSLNSMLRSGKELRIFPIRAEDLKRFCKEAKKYGVLYYVLRQKKAKDGIVDVMARAEDASKISRIFERLNLAAVDMESVRAEVIPTREGPASENEVPELVSPDHSPDDTFLFDLFSPAPSRETPATPNPTMATGSAPSRSAPSSETTKPPSAETEQPAPTSGKPSVRKELEALRREQQAGRKKDEPQRKDYPEHKAPKKKRKKEKSK